MAINGPHTVSVISDKGVSNDITGCLIYAERSMNAFYQTANTVAGPHMLLCDIQYFPILQTAARVNWTDPQGNVRTFRVAALPQDFVSDSMGEDLDHVEVLLSEQSQR